MSEQEKPESSKIENAEQNNHAQSDKAVESVPKCYHRRHLQPVN